VAIGLASGCGAADEPGSGPGAASAAANADANANPMGNAPPRIDRVQLLPEQPTRADVLQLTVDALDPDRDSLRFDVEWFRNGATHSRGSALQLGTDDLRQGDLIHARVSVNDGHSSAVAESPSVRIANSSPRITRLELLPEEPTGADSLMVTVESSDPDSEETSHRYEWWKNDERLDDVDGATLDASRVGRGDEIWVRVTPSDGRVDGEPLRSQTRLVRNAPPRITSEPSYGVAGPNLYEYSVTANDPDGDRPLRFDLVDGPDGMEIDLVTGQLSWVVPPSFRGTFMVEVAVRDPLGAESRQRYAIDLTWETPELPASADPAPSPDPDPYAR
jgi:hypothetical protein